MSLNKDQTIEECKKFGSGYAVFEIIWPVVGGTTEKKYEIFSLDSHQNAVSKLQRLGALTGKRVWCFNCANQECGVHGRNTDKDSATRSRRKKSTKTEITE